MTSDKRIAVFPGSFDPFTCGHEDIVRRVLPLFDEVVIAIGTNSKKKREFDLDFLKNGITGCFAESGKVRVMVYEGLTALFAKEVGARFLIRGLRNTTDFEYENPISEANKHIYPELETIFLFTSPQFAYYSSSIVRELYKFGLDVQKFVPFKMPEKTH